MNRKTKSIIYWIVAGIFIAIFFITLFFGGISSIFETGSRVYNSVGSFLTSMGMNRSTIYSYSPYVCVLSGVILAYMFYKRFNTRIN